MHQSQLSLIYSTINPKFKATYEYIHLQHIFILMVNMRNFEAGKSNKVKYILRQKRKSSLLK